MADVVMAVRQNMALMARMLANQAQYSVGALSAEDGRIPIPPPSPDLDATRVTRFTGKQHRAHSSPRQEPLEAARFGSRPATETRPTTQSRVQGSDSDQIAGLLGDSGRAPAGASRAQRGLSSSSRRGTNNERKDLTRRDHSWASPHRRPGFQAGPASHTGRPRQPGRVAIQSACAGFRSSAVQRRNRGPPHRPPKYSSSR